MLVSPAFDHLASRLPDNVRYVGTPIEDADFPAWRPRWDSHDRRPLVLVSLSTLNQAQASLMRRNLVAMAGVEARVLVTLGPALDPTEFPAPPNVHLERFVPHSAVLPHTAAMVTQCGVGTLAKALAHGVPLLCIPLVGDQPENAARVFARGAGLRLRGEALPREILCCSPTSPDGAAIPRRCISVGRRPNARARRDTKSGAGNRSRA
jgi:UDP:flavonoid glycosyltransferase YjiC (YdhE family)